MSTCWTENRQVYSRRSISTCNTSPTRKQRKQDPVPLPKVTYRDEKGHIYQFIINNFEISDQVVAFIYKKRWSIQLVFKKLKQNFKLHYFYSETEKGIKYLDYPVIVDDTQDQDENKKGLFHCGGIDPPTSGQQSGYLLADRELFKN